MYAPSLLGIRVLSIFSATLWSDTMHDVEFVGGSLDGSHVKVAELRPTLRLPPAPGMRWSEVYERQEDGLYHFVRHGVPPLMLLPESEEAEANRVLTAIVESMMPLLDRLEAHFAQRGGYTQLTLGAWMLTRRDDVPAAIQVSWQG